MPDNDSPRAPLEDRAAERLAQYQQGWERLLQKDNSFSSNSANWIAPLATFGGVLAAVAAFGMLIGPGAVISATTLAVGASVVAMAATKTGLFAPKQAGPGVKQEQSSKAENVSTPDRDLSMQNALQEYHSDVATAVSNAALRFPAGNKPGVTRLKG
jgi:hypothetical protein